MSTINRSVRLTAQTTASLDINTHNNGEIFYDPAIQTLRLFNGKDRGGTKIATQPWVNYAITTNVGTTVNLINQAITQLEANQKKTSFTATAPINPQAGDSWVNVSNGNMYVYYNDGNSSQWIQPVKNNLSISTTGLGSFSSGTGVSETFVNTAINDVRGSAPSNLNTLGKIATAINNDPNFLSSLNSTISTLAPALNPTFTGTVSGITAAMVGLGNVTNESKATMFNNPTFTGTVSGILISAESVGLGNVTNQSKTTMFNNPTFTGTVGGITKAMVGLGNVTNESKATMFTSPTFTGTVSGVTATHVGLGNVTNESKATMFTSPAFTGTVTGVTKSMVGLSNVTNESKTTMFTSPTFTGTVSGVTKTHVGLSNVENTALSTWAGSANITTLGTVTSGSAPASDVYAWAKAATKPSYTATDVGLGNVTNESKATMFTSPTFTGTMTSQQSTEVYSAKFNATGVVVHDFSTGAIWSHETIAANFTANFTNMPTTSGRTIVCTLMILQGATAYIPNAVQIDGVAQTISWQGGSAPTGTANKREIVSFTFVRSASWFVLGSLTSYG